MHTIRTWQRHSRLLISVYSCIGTAYTFSASTFGTQVSLKWRRCIGVLGGMIFYLGKWLGYEIDSRVEHGMGPCIGSGVWCYVTPSRWYILIVAKVRCILGCNITTKILEWWRITSETDNGSSFERRRKFEICVWDWTGDYHREDCKYAIEKIHVRGEKISLIWTWDGWRWPDINGLDLIDISPPPYICVWSLAEHLRIMFQLCMILCRGSSPIWRSILPDDRRCVKTLRL